MLSRKGEYMQAMKAVRSRRSISCIKPDPVPRKVLEGIFDTCRWAPSSRNTQPWEFAILGGKVMEEVKTRLTEKISAEAAMERDIPEPELRGIYLQRVMELRELVDISQFPPGTENLDEKRAEYWIRGGCFHDAPNGIIIYMERDLYPKGLLGIGMILQTISLVALAYGLATCHTGRVVNWPDMLRELLGIPQSKSIVLGIAIGYPLPGAPINNFVRQRQPLESFVHWHGF